MPIIATMCTLKVSLFMQPKKDHNNPKFTLHQFLLFLQFTSIWIVTSYFLLSVHFPSETLRRHRLLSAVCLFFNHSKCRTKAVKCSASSGSWIFHFYLPHLFLLLSLVLMCFKSLPLAKRWTASLAVTTMLHLPQPVPYSHSNLWAFGLRSYCSDKRLSASKPHLLPRLQRAAYKCRKLSPVTTQKQSWCLHLAQQQVHSLR